MTTTTGAIEITRSKQGMISVSGSLFLFSFQDMVIKSFSDAYSVLQVVFTRSLIALCLLCAYALITIGVRAFVAKQPGLLLAKGCIYFFAFLFYYMAFPALPVADVVAVTFLAPIIVTLLSIILLKEKVGVKLWGGVIVGFIGVLIVIGPEGKIVNIGTLLAFACALTYGFGSVLTRYITKGDQPITIAIYSMTVLMLISGVGYLVIMVLKVQAGMNPSFNFLVREWVWIVGQDAWLLVFIGTIASVGFYLHGRAYLIAPASHVAPFEYTYVFFTVFLAYIIFDEEPTVTTLVGLAILVSSSLYIWYESNKIVAVNS